MCASRLIWQARRWRASSAGERRSRSSCRIGPGSSMRVGPPKPRARVAELGRQADHARIERRGAEPVHQRGTVDRVLAQLGIELLDRIGGVGAVRRDGALDAGAVAVPDLHLAVARAHEQHVALLGVRRVEDRHRVRLVEPGEEEEVGVLAEGMADVAVAGRLRRRRHDRHGVADRLREPPPPLDEGRQLLARHPFNLPDT